MTICYVIVLLCRRTQHVQSVDNPSEHPKLDVRLSSVLNDSI